MTAEGEVTEAEKAASLVSGAIRRRRRRGLVRRNIYHFPRPRIMELLAGLLFNPLGIGFQLIHFTGILLVFLLQLLDIFLHALVLSLFRAVDHRAVCAKGDVNEQPDGKDRNRDCSDPATQFVQLCQIRFKCCLNSARPSFSLVRSMGERSQPLLWRRKDADSGNAYSKIHCLAAALSFERAGSLQASE